MDLYQNPVTIDLKESIRPGANRVDVRRRGAESRATAQLVASHYKPWNNVRSSTAAADSSSALQLSVQFSKTNAAVGEEIVCSVKAERIGSGDHGMLIAEIGLPPGAEVDRDSLDKTLSRGDWSLDQYDILPDRLLIYLWPRDGGTTFQFSFRPRFRINAQTPASILYDYYNPDAEAFCAPVRFVVAPR